ncbi:transposase [Streptomyces sp. NPDC098781]|uniref:transposase n=1 Tax=Streptomyces sp. NPDC098781 TaxID=3366097 RepID=UPI003820E1E5
MLSNVAEHSVRAGRAHRCTAVADPQRDFDPEEHLIEKSLADQYAVARHTLRIALQTLESEGLLRREPRRGVFVASVEPEDVLDIFRAHDAMRHETAGKTQITLARHLAGLRPRRLEEPYDALRHALRTLAKRWQYLDTEAKELTKLIADLVRRAAPQLLEPFGIGVDPAAESLVVAGDNPERIKSEAALAKLAGVAPVPTGSGMTSGRHRINHGGHRQLNAAVYRTVIVRMRFHQPTIDYVARRTAEGKTRREIFRCLKRYVIRDVHLIRPAPTTS